MPETDKQPNPNEAREADSSFEAFQNETLPPGSSSSVPVGPPSHKGDECTALPDRISRYRVERVLGEGAFGRVYLAHDEELSRRVAIKVPHPRQVMQLADVDEYLEEARTLANLDHPAIVPAYDIGRLDDGGIYVVSKFVEGSDLAARIKRERLSKQQAARLIADIAEALHHAHKQNIVHRDVKPANILLDHEDKPFLADFGLALKEDDLGKGAEFAGTLVYMSPEQARGQANLVDGRSDIFSLGVVLYELLTGQRPFRGDSAQDILKQITSVNVRPPRQRDDTIPIELERICLKALAIEMSSRYTTAKDMADDLHSYVSSSASESVSTTVSRPATAVDTDRPATDRGQPSTVKNRPKSDASQPRRNHFKVVALIALPLIALPLIAIGILIAYLARPDTPPPDKTWQPQYINVKPKIIGIYPSDAFGPDRKAGLHALADGHPSIKVVDLDSASIDQMKRGDIGDVLAKLTEMIESDNVVAIIGPPITECTYSVLETVAKTGKRIPVIVETAGARGIIGWDEFHKQVPVFRISSGVDRRAKEIALVIDQSIHGGQPVTLLVEQHVGTGRNTYGEHLYEEIRRHVGKWEDYRNEGKLDITYFPTNDVQSVLPSLATTAADNGVMILLGLGKHYVPIADALYRTDVAATPKAKLVGWMNAYATDKEFRKSDYHFDLLYEITDFDITDHGPRPRDYGKFESKFGEANPALRDQAFSFDAAFCAIRAFMSVNDDHFDQRSGYYPKVDGEVLKHLEHALRTMEFNGVTGDIRFGQEGQNKDGRLDYTRFNKEDQNWRVVNYTDLLQDAP